MDSGVVNTIATCISALAACGSTYFAARVIRDNRDARRMELESARPYFTFSNFGLRRQTVAKALSSEQELLDPRLACIEGLIANDGRRSASNVSGAVLILPIKFDAKAGTFSVGIADDVAPTSEWHISTAHLSVIPEGFSGYANPTDYRDPGFFVLIYVRYTDPLTSKTYAQNSFMRWPGISGGIIAGNLLSASHEEKSMLLERYSAFLKPYMDGKPTNTEGMHHGA
jgi:hypothetical protein